MNARQADATVIEEVLASCLADCLDEATDTFKRGEYATQAMKSLSSDLMPTEAHALIFSVMEDAWERGEMPSGAVIMAEAKAKWPGKSADKTLAVKTAWARIEALHSRSPRTALEIVKRYAQEQDALIRWKDVGKKLEAGDLDGADEIFRSGLRLYDAMDDYVLARWMENFEKRQEARQAEAENPDLSLHVRTGFKTFDALLNGGLGPRRKQGIGILAATNVGKTALAINWGYEGVLQNQHVVHVTTEMDYMSTATRYDVRFAGMASDRFLRFNFDADELALLAQMVAEFRAKVHGEISFVQMPLSDCTRDKVERALKQAEREKGKIGVIVFDSPDHLKSGRKLATKDSYRLEQAGNFWWFKGMLDLYDAVGYATIQAGSQVVGGRATAEDVSEAYDKARHLDVIASLNRTSKKLRATPADEINEKDYAPDAEIHVGTSGLFLHVPKNRHGLALVDIPLEAHLDRMLICDAGDEDDWLKAAAPNRG